MLDLTKSYNANVIGYWPLDDNEGNLFHSLGPSLEHMTINRGHSPSTQASFKWATIEELGEWTGELIAPLPLC